MNQASISAPRYKHRLSKLELGRRLQADRSGHDTGGQIPYAEHEGLTLDLV